MAFALFAPRPNSHPFQERQLALKEPVKIGRAVAKAKSTQNNGIFDCKVLSRNHAVMWYENGKFMLQDTKSSNGTYVNNVRLSRGSEESEPCEIKSGDVLQFGVEVVENSKNVTHGCIVGLVTLFHEDGSEATGAQVDSTTHGVMTLLTDKTIQPQELWQLSQFLQDALHREQMMENKLATLQRMIANSHAASEDTFQGFIQEDKLLSRLETLENQLQLVCADMSDTDIQSTLIKMHDDQLQYESAAKEKLQILLKEKIDILQKCGDIERLLSNTEDECSHLRTVNQKLQEQLVVFMENYKKQANELEVLNEQFSESKKLHDSTVQQNAAEIKELKTQLEDAEKRGSAIAVEVESLQAECDFTKKQLNAMKERLEQQQVQEKQQQEQQQSAQEMQHLVLVEDSLNKEDFKASTEDLPFASDHATLEKDVKNKSLYINTLKQKISDLQSTLNEEKNKNSVDNQRTETELLYLIHQAQELEELLVASRELIESMRKLKEQDDEQWQLSSHSWHSTHETLDVHPLTKEGQIRTLKDVLLSNKILLELINDDFETMLKKVPDNHSTDNEYQLKDELTSAYAELADVRNQIIILGDQLVEEQDTNRRAKELAATLEYQLYEAHKHMNLEALDKSLSYSSLESARQLATEMQKQASEYSKAARQEKVESSNVHEENETLKMKVNRLESELKRLNQENKLLAHMETPRKGRKTQRAGSTDAPGSEDKEENSVKEENTQSFICEDFQERLDLADQSLDELFHEREIEADLPANEYTQLLNILLILFILIVGFGALTMLGIINVTPGTLPLLDYKTWTDILEILF